MSLCCKLQVGLNRMSGMFRLNSPNIKVHASNIWEICSYLQNQDVPGEVRLGDERGRNWRSWAQARAGGQDWGTLPGEFLWSWSALTTNPKLSHSFLEIFSTNFIVGRLSIVVVINIILTFRSLTRRKGEWSCGRRSCTTWRSRSRWELKVVSLQAFKIRQFETPTKV